MAASIEFKPEIQTLSDNLRAQGIDLKCFDTAGQATDYLDSQLDRVTIGVGGSMTVQQMELYPRLRAHNDVRWHWEDGATPEQAVGTYAYISSLNAIAQTGELVNIDGGGNRVASTLYGHKRVYFVVGINKLVPDYTAALWRARNVAAPKNAQRLGRNTPCAVKGDRCYNCKSPERICRELAVIWQKPLNVELMEVVLIGEALGF